MLQVVKAGPRTLLQDLGRFGVARCGLSQGGPLDLFSFCAAQYLLSNSMHLAALEITLGNAQFEFTKSTAFSLTGAPVSPLMNGTPIEMWRSYSASAGDTLELSYASSGTHCYLSVYGGFLAPKVCESVSTVERNYVGGLDGKGVKIQNGDTLPYQGVDTFPRKVMSPAYIPSYESEEKIKFIVDERKGLFEETAIETFCSSEYELLPVSDRMGYRLRGAKVETLQSGITSEGVSLGSIQIPSDGQPIVLMQDRQTIGGYPKLGCVSKLDITRFSQTRIGEKVRFERVFLDQAKAEWERFCHFFKLSA